MPHKDKKVPRHPVHAIDRHSDLLNLTGLESDRELEIALRARGNVITSPRTVETILESGDGDVVPA